MRQRRTTVPPTRVASRSSQSGRSELIARTKTETQSAKRRPVLDNRFHRTDLRFTRANRCAEKCSSWKAGTQRFA